MRTRQSYLLIEKNKNFQNKFVCKIQRAARNYLCNSINAMKVNENALCMICMDDDTKLCVKMPCMHKFHASCISKWLMHEKSCPICRSFCEDQKRVRIEKEFEDMKELMNIPIHTLLGFSSATPIEVYLESFNFNLSKVSQFIQKGRRNFEFIDPNILGFIETKIKMYEYLDKAIQKYDKRSRCMLLNSTDNPVIKKICQKYKLPFEFISETNPWKELQYLSNFSEQEVKTLRHHIIKYWELQKIIQKDYVREDHHLSLRRMIQDLSRHRPISIEFT